MTQEHATPSVRSICDRLTREAIAAECGVGLNAVGAAVAAGLFPAKWFAKLSAMCEPEGIECPQSLFNFIWTPKPRKPRVLRSEAQNDQAQNP